jgi:hypothetical protein
MEVLVALAVLGVATATFISTYRQSVDLGEGVRDRRIAASLAEEKLAELTQSPAAFTWPAADALASGQLQPVQAKNADPAAPQTVKPPLVLPAQIVRAEREMNYYKKFTSAAYARLPEEGAGYIELTVVIEWTQNQRPYRYSLTSAIARGRVEGRS